MSAPGRLPDFVIIGAAKAGTTTLHAHLARHPRIAMAHSDDPGVRDKEPAFFDPAVNWGRGVDWYRSLWSRAGPDQLCGEATTNYTRHPQVEGVAARMAALVPRARLIYLMRHPVERAYSHYVHRWTRELHPGEPFTESFESFVRHDPMCLDGSDYRLQIEQFLAHYPREQLLLLRLDDLERDPRALVDRALAFLGLETGADLAPDEAGVRNPGGVSEKVLRKNALGRLRRLPGVAPLVRSAVPRPWRDRAWRALRSTPWGQGLRAAYVPPPMGAEARAALLERYRPSNAWLRDEFGVDTSSWER